MRRNRIILLVLWLLSLVGISLFGGNISYGFFILLSLLPFVSLIYIICVSLLFRIYQHIDTHSLIANHSAPFEFILQNDSIIPFAGIKLLFYPQFSFISDLDELMEYEVFPGQSIKKQTSIICRYRGEYHIGIDKVVIQDFFRLFTITHKIRDSLLVRVRPDVIRLSEHKQVEMAFNAVSESRHKRNTADILTREYVSGDDPRLINWKVSAALNKLMVREQIGEEQQGIGIIMDSCRYSTKISEYLPIENKILETVIAFNLFFTERGIPVHTYFAEDELQEFRAERGNGFNEIYDRLSLFSFSTDKKAQKLCTDILSSGSYLTKAAVLFVVHKWDNSFSMLSAELEKNNIPQVIYLISDDPDAADVLNRTAEKTEVVIIGPDQDLKEII